MLEVQKKVWSSLKRFFVPNDYECEKIVEYMNFRRLKDNGVMSCSTHNVDERAIPIGPSSSIECRYGPLLRYGTSCSIFLTAIICLDKWTVENVPTLSGWNRSETVLTKKNVGKCQVISNIFRCNICLSYEYFVES